MNVSKYQRVGLDVAGSGDESELQWLDLVSAEQGDRGRGEGDGSPSTVGLGRLEAQSGTRFLKAALHLERGRVQIDIAPCQGQKLAAPHARAKREGDDRIERVTV